MVRKSLGSQFSELGRKAQREKHGDNYSAEMRRRAGLSHKAQVDKYGSIEAYKAEMKRRRAIRTAKQSDNIMVEGKDNE